MLWTAPPPGTRVPWIWAPLKAPLIRRSYPCSRFRQSVSISPSRSFKCTALMPSGQVVIRRQLKRRFVQSFFEKLPPCLVGIEACASSHHWSRELQALGHTVRLMPPAYVKPYVKRQKNDTTIKLCRNELHWRDRRELVRSSG
jgi:transposase